MSEKSSGAMSVIDHLTELRTTLLWALGLAAGAAVLAWFFSDAIVDALLRPAREAGQETLYFTAPMEAFLLKLKASAVVGLLLVLPLILYRVYLFVLPGLMPQEKKVVTPLLVAATGLFYVGVAFCYLVLMPLIIRFAVGFATESLQPWLTAGSYFELAARLCLAFGLLFELPMVVFALSWVGVVHPRTLLKGWRYALVCILLVAAVLTPPDLISQVLLAGPVMLLYIASVLISMVVRNRRDKARALSDGDDDDPDDDDPDDPEDPPSGPDSDPGGEDGPTDVADPPTTGASAPHRRSPRVESPGPEMGQPTPRDGFGGSEPGEEN